jgi:hypothetical protein
MKNFRDGKALSNSLPMIPDKDVVEALKASNAMKLKKEPPLFAMVL